MMIILQDKAPPVNAIEYGKGLFETLAMKTWGKPIALDLHLDRLNRALSFFGADARLEFDQVMEAIKGHKTHIEPAQVKIILYLAGKDAYCQFIFKPYPYDEADLSKGFKIFLSPAVQISSNPLNYHKTLNYWERLEILNHAKNEGFDEVVRLNERGEVCEGAKTNIFVYHDKTWYTPPIETGILCGVTRQLFMDWLLEKGESLKVSAFDATFLKEADTIALTNSLIGSVEARFKDDAPKTSNHTIDAFRMHYLGG